MDSVLPRSWAAFYERRGPSLRAAAPIAGGVLWMGMPYVVTSIEARLINAAYVLPLLLIAVGVLEVARFQSGPEIIGFAGLVLTIVALGVAILGSLLEALLSIPTLIQLGVGTGTVFFLGFYGLLVVSPVLGIGLWRSFEGVFFGPLLFVVALPIAFGGFFWMTANGFEELNWIPVTVSYGLAWVVFGYRLYAETAVDPDRRAEPA